MPGPAEVQHQAVQRGQRLGQGNADGEPANRSHGQTLISRGAGWGDGVWVAGSSAEAVQRVRALRPDVVLIDIRLGQESGFDAARQLAGNGQPTALIMISTHAAADYADLIAESPAAGFVPKAELSAAAIRRILGAG
jgi:DNA-binding NarL/FixJ family response regulator